MTSFEALDETDAELAGIVGVQLHVESRIAAVPRTPEQSLFSHGYNFLFPAATTQQTAGVTPGHGALNCESTTH